MIQKSAFRIVSMAAILGAAFSAQAYVLTFTGTYSGTFLTANAFTVNTTNTQGLNFNFAVDPTSTASAAGGTASLSTRLRDFTGTKTLSLTSLSGTSATFGGTTSFAGTWSGTTTGLGINNNGTYSGSVDGLGNYAISITGQPVPEPATMVALGVGALGLLRRRRKA